MEFKGYKIPKKVKLVKTYPSEYNPDFNDSTFVVDGDSDSQLETAIKWASGYCNEDKRQYVKDNIIETDNEGFEVEFLYSANNSSQGGKLSFWDCKITKDGQEYIVGINQALLLELIKSTTIINGKVQEKCLFIKQRNNTGIVSKNSEIYKECLKEVQEKERIQSLKTTTAWEKGYFYNTLTQSDVYVSDVYVWYKEEEISYWKSKIKILDKPIKMKYMLGSYYFKDTNKLSDVFKNDYFPGVRYNCKKTLPSRYKSDKKIEIDLSTEELEQLRLQQIENKDLSSREKQSLCLISFINRKPESINKIKDFSYLEIEF